MGSLDGRVEQDRLAGVGQAPAELDVFDRRVRVPRFVEPADVEERGAPHRSEPGPERVGGTCARLVDVVVQQVPEGRHRRRRTRRVVVRAVDRGQGRIGGVGSADAHERVAVHLHIGVDEHDHVPRRPAHALVAGTGRGELRRVLDDDDLVGRDVGAGDRVEAAFERDGPVGSGNDGGEGHHGAGIIWLAAP